MEKNCAFQYAYKAMFDVKIVSDTDLITLDEAKELYRKYLPDFIEKLKEKSNPEMVIWVNMKDPSNYHDSLVYLDSHLETDGYTLWKNTREYIPTI